MKTQSANPKCVEHKWFVVDAENQVLGRLCTRIATVLRGKHKTQYTPHVDTGDFVIVLNAEKVRLTGNKEEGKLYHRHTEWMGGLVTKDAATLRKTDPTALITHAVKGMLPKNTLGRQMLKKLKVYAGSEHHHQAQQPQVLSVG